MNGRLVHFNGLFKGVSPRSVRSWYNGEEVAAPLLFLPCLAHGETERKRDKEEAQVKKTLKVPCH